MTKSTVILPILEQLPKVVWQNGFSSFLDVAPEIRISNAVKRRVPQSWGPAQQHTFYKFWTTPIFGYASSTPSSVTTISDFLATSEGQKSNSVIMNALNENTLDYLWGVPEGWTQSEVINRMFYSHTNNLKNFQVAFYPKIENNYALNLADLSILTDASSIRNKTLVGDGSVYVNGMLQSGTAINQVLIAPKKDGVAITDTLTFSTTATASTSTSTTRGVSSASSQSIGLKLSDALQSLPGANLELDMSTSKSASVNISSTKAQINSKSYTQSNSITVKVEPGQSILAEQTYTQQEITIPFSLPATITGSSTVDINLWSKGLSPLLYSPPAFKYSNSYSGRDVLKFADYDGYIPVLASNLATGSVLAEGEITNVNVGLFEATDSRYKKNISVYSSPSIVNTQALNRLSLDDSGESTESKVLTREDTLSRRIAHNQLPTVLINGKQETVGVYYSAEDSQSTSVSPYHLGGSDLDDIINMTLKGQSAYSYGGDDRIYGSRFNDKIYLDGGLDLAQGGEGDDTITSYSGAHLIDSGSGSDTINIHLDKQEDSLGAHEINLGHGNDILSIFKNNRELDSIIAVVNDFSSADSIHLNGFDNLTGEVIAGSLYFKENDQFISKLANYSGSFDPASTRGELIEYSLLNAGSINFDPSFSGTCQDVVNKMATAQILHQLDPLTEYSDLLVNKNTLNQSLNAIAIALDLDSKKFLSAGLDSADQFNSISTLTSHVIQSVIGNKDTGIMDYIAWL